MKSVDYLKRIGLNGPINPSIEALRVLQKAHLLSVPFENFDIHNATPIILDLNKIYNKIVLNNRGGFCYELNGLFYWLLKELNFDVSMISGRVYDSVKGYGPEFDHLALIVSFGQERYITDVGFGEFVFLPIKFELNVTHKDPRGHFMINPHDADYYRIDKIEGDKNIAQYIFKNQKRELKDFTSMCDFHQSSPLSHFSKKKFISKATENGKVTLSDQTLKITHKGEVKESTLDADAYNSALRKYFNLC